LEHVREREARRPRADDPDLGPGGAQPLPSSSSTRCAIANAPLAAGTPQ
jgi:hypothetical protein